MPTFKIAVIPGDGVGVEVVAEGRRVLEVVAKRERNLTLRFTTFDWGSAYYKKHGRMMPADALDTLRTFDAIYLGAVGDPSVPDHVTLHGLLLPIRRGFDQYANVRPAFLFLGVPRRAAGRGPDSQGGGGRPRRRQSSDARPRRPLEDHGDHGGDPDSALIERSTATAEFPLPDVMPMC